METEFEIEGDEIRFLRYPFAPASVHSGAVVRATDIRDADPGIRVAPPEVRLHTGETIYLARGHEPLRQFCADHGVPLVHRPDVWGNLLEPFVDTEFDGYWEERTRVELARWAFTVDEVEAIRQRFAAPMLAYNSIMWDWVHLGLYDLLLALSGRLTPSELTLPPDELQTVYWWAMDLAERSRVDAEPLR